MIKFYRKIRQNLIMENKTSKYLKYAIGEIVLVVIGILMALQINNWNEQNNKEAKIVNTLKEIQNDILIDLVQANRIFDYQVYTDSISKGVFNNRFTAEDYRSNKVQKIGYNYRDFKTVTNGFDNLKGHIDNVPKKYTDLLPDIKNLYVRLKIDLDVANDKIRNTVYKNVDNMYNFKWSQESLKGTMSEVEIDYLLHNKAYKDLVANYMNYRLNIFALTNEYRVAAIDLYLKIHEAIGSEDNIPDIINYNNAASLNDYTGTYTLKETVNPDFWPETITIEETDGELKMFFDEAYKINFFYYNQNTFFSEDYYGFAIFDTSKKEEVYLSRETNFYVIYEKSDSK